MRNSYLKYQLSQVLFCIFWCLCKTWFYFSRNKRAHTGFYFRDWNAENAEKFCFKSHLYRKSYALKIRWTGKSYTTIQNDEQRRKEGKFFSSCTCHIGTSASWDWLTRTWCRCTDWPSENNNYVWLACTVERTVIHGGVKRNVTLFMRGDVYIPHLWPLKKEKVRIGS